MTLNEKNEDMLEIEIFLLIAIFELKILTFVG